MILCTLTPDSEIIDIIFQALDKAISGHVPAGYSNYPSPSYYSVDSRTGRFYVDFSFCSMSSGATSC